MVDQQSIQSSPQSNIQSGVTGVGGSHIPLTLLQQDPSIIRDILSPDTIIEMIKHSLKGEYWDATKGKDGQWVRAGTPLMNDKGINQVITILRPFTNSLIFLSNIDEKMVNKITLDISFAFIEAFYLSYEDYGIKDENLDIVRNMVVVPIYASLRRSVNEGEKVFLTKSMFEGRNFNIPMASEKKKPWWKII